MPEETTMSPADKKSAVTIINRWRTRRLQDLGPKPGTFGHEYPKLVPSPVARKLINEINERLAALHDLGWSGAVSGAHFSPAALRAHPSRRKQDDEYSKGEQTIAREADRLIDLVHAGKLSMDAVLAHTEDEDAKK